MAFDASEERLVGGAAGFGGLVGEEGTVFGMVIGRWSTVVAACHDWRMREGLTRALSRVWLIDWLGVVLYCLQIQAQREEMSADLAKEMVKEREQGVV